MAFGQAVCSTVQHQRCRCLAWKGVDSGKLFHFDTMTSTRRHSGRVSWGSEVPNEGFDFFWVLQGSMLRVQSASTHCISIPKNLADKNISFSALSPTHPYDPQARLPPEPAQKIASPGTTADDSQPMQAQTSGLVGDP